MKKGIIFAGLFFLLTFGSCMLGMQPQIGYFPESSFTLSPDSRLPKWFSIPAGYDRKDLTVQIFYYAPWLGKTNIKAILIGSAPNNPITEKKYGHVETLSTAEKKTDYPNFQIANLGGITEIIKHKKMEPIFYISDDQKLIRH